MKNTTIKWKLLIYILSAFLFIYACTFAFILIYSKQKSIQFHKEKSENETIRYSYLLKSYMDSKFEMVRTLALLLENIDSQKETSQIQELCSTALRKKSDVTSVWVALLKEQGVNEQVIYQDNINLVVCYKDNFNKVQVAQNQNEQQSASLLNYIVAKTEFITNPFYYTYSPTQTKESFIARIGIPIMQNDVYKGMVGIDIDLRKLDEIITQNHGGISLGYGFILSNNCTYVAHIDKTLVGNREGELFAEYAKMNNIEDNVRNGLPFSFIFDATTKSEDFKKDRDYISYRTYVPVEIGNTHTPWCFAFVYPIDKAIQEFRGTLYWFVLSAVIGLLILGAITWQIANTMSTPLMRINKALSRISKGKVYRIDTFASNNNDEIGKIAYSVNVLAQNLNNIADFAKAIGKGDLETHFEALKKDVIGNSLLEMRESLKKSDLEEVKRKIEDEKRNWTTQGIAHFSDILRQNNDNLALLSDQILKYLIHYLNVNQGGLFIYNDDDKSNIHLYLAASYAYDTKKFTSKSMLLGEGLVGMCAMERKTTYLSEIPDNYIEITSGLGDASPSFLLLIPLIIEQQIMGVIELASFNEFKAYEIEFVEKIGENIASTLSSVRITGKTQKLLEYSRQQAEEMSEKEELMRQNMEELQATQEELQRKNDENERIHQVMRKEQLLFEELIQNIPILVYFKDNEGRYLKVSRSLVAYHKKTTPADILGRTDFDFFSDKCAMTASDTEQEIIRSGKSVTDILEKQTFIDGTTRYVKTYKFPLYNPEGAIYGIVGFSIDVTELETLKSKSL